MSDAVAPPFAAGVYTGAGEATRLLGGRCPASGRTWFPAAAEYPENGATIQTVELAPGGALYSYTVVRTKPPFGLPQPYAVGYVDLDGGPRVFALLDPTAIDRLRIGLRVTVTSGRLGVNLAGEPCARPYFVPERG